ncbi:hypothetical protein Q8F57_003295 [Paraburkholderia terrae]|uniref:hypothetical protein n=1 Tax=Paraburkholderia terrae TaxID=311230 RepID=UPI00296B52AC|nr:hypothetical protein [Paraburkholderia terrae]MDW3655449.1 hypothetical protein [Paraburkholderia terrae]
MSIAEHLNDEEKEIPRVRAMFQLQEIANQHYSPTSKRLKFSAMYDTNIPEHRRLQKATPWGIFEMTVDNPAALEMFELGKHYHFDITPA